MPVAALQGNLRIIYTSFKVLTIVGERSTVNIVPGVPLVVNIENVEGIPQVTFQFRRPTREELRFCLFNVRKLNLSFECPPEVTVLGSVEREREVERMLSSARTFVFHLGKNGRRLRIFTFPQGELRNV